MCSSADEKQVVKSYLSDKLRIFMSFWERNTAGLVWVVMTAKRRASMRPFFTRGA